jgi:hypothetical protein
MASPGVKLSTSTDSTALIIGTASIARPGTAALSADDAEPRRQVASASSSPHLSNTAPNQAILQWRATEFVPPNASDASYSGTESDAVARFRRITEMEKRR